MYVRYGKLVKNKMLYIEQNQRTIKTMAIYHYHREIGKRASGKNAVFAVAYIRGEKRTCDKNGETKDFTSKPDVIYKNTFIPEDAPLWALELRNSTVIDSEGKKHTDTYGESFSSYAWNQIEFAEKRKDSQLYFHDDIAIPNILNQEQAIELVNDFVKTTLAINGIFCDAAIHWDNGNHHFHVLMPLRAMTDTGFGKKIRTSKTELAQEVKRIRSAWAVAANQKMQSLGIDERIDHRSYQERGIALTPTVKVGKFNHFKDQSIPIRKLTENDLIRKTNSEAIQGNPEILAEKILQERRSFDSQAVSDEIARYVILEDLKSDITPDKEIIDPVLARLLESLQTTEGIINERTLKKNVLEATDSKEAFDRIYSSIVAHEDIFSLGIGEDGREHFVGRQAFNLENDLLKTTYDLATRHTFAVSKTQVNIIAERFGLNESQLGALSHLVAPSNATIVCGYAGTGKTYMLKAAREVWEESGYKLIGLSTAGKAASGLQTETGIYSRTIYSFLEAVKNQKIIIDNKTILIMDEMGMTSLDDMHAVMEIARTHGAKFAGIGDIEQTQPVGRGAPQRAMVETIGARHLDIIIRQEKEWQRQATILMETSKTAVGFDLYESHGCVRMHATTNIAMTEMVNHWCNDNVFLKDSIMAAFKNETVNALNILARQKLVDKGVLEQGYLIETERGNIQIAANERLLFKKNDSGIGVRNGDFATVLSFSEDLKTMQVELDNGKIVELMPSSYKYFDYGYAATVHKLQGHTTRDCHVLIDGEGWDRHKFLVAASRHKQNLMIHAATENFATMDDLKTAVSRHGLNDILADFPVAFAERRGFSQKTSSTMATGLIQKTKTRIYDAVGFLFNYQEAIEQGQSAYELAASEMDSRRKNAVIVAEFCDNRMEVATLLDQIKNLEETAKPPIQELVYALQVRNGEIAAIIKSQPEQYTKALERNRLGHDKIEAAFSFNICRQRVHALVEAHENKASISPLQASELTDNIKAHYGHICHRLQDKDIRNVFMREVEHRADIHRRDTALSNFGLEKRVLVNAVARYKSLDYEIGTRLKELANATDADKKELYKASIQRDKLAFEFSSNPDGRAVTEHFAIKPERLMQHAGKYQDRQYVKAFAEMTKTRQDLGNLQRQVAAHRIKAQPKRYGIYIDEYLKDGWKQVNLENWSYKKRLAFASSSPELKESIKLIRRYKATAIGSYVQWQKAIAKSQENSPHKKTGFNKAQGISWKRSLLAHEIMGSIHKHVAALKQEKVDTGKLYQQALHVDYLNRYRHETRNTLKLHMARHIHSNLKNFQAGLAVYGLYGEVKEYATHFAYLQRIKEAPAPELKSLIRLAVDYQDKKVEAGIVWSQVKALEKLKLDTRGLTLQARLLMTQRNQAAHTLLENCTQKDWLTKENIGINLDAVKLRREADQHITQQTLNSYLAANPEVRQELASALLSSKASYHLLGQHGVRLETLKIEARNHEKTRHLNPDSDNQPNIATQKKISAPKYDIDRVTEALMSDPVSTYKAILGEPKEQNSNHLRYNGGLVISTKGSNAGKWYSFTDETGGTPLQAIQKYLNLSFAEALAHGASLAGIGEMDASINRMSVTNIEKAIPMVDNKLLNGVTSAKSIWDGTVNADNTLAERYFTGHRKVDSIAGMEIRYWPKGAIWVDFDEEGNRIEKPNKIPAAVIAARNAQGEVASVQRIYLDERTAGKNTFLKDAKLTKGSNRGMPGVIQTGIKGGALYIAEGPETAASIATLHRDATVLVSFSVSNISQMATVIKTHAPQKIILAADNDGESSPSRKTTEKAVQALRSEGLDVRIAYPDMLEGKIKTDWNDVLVVKGKEFLQQHFHQKCAQTQTLYEKAIPIAETDAIQYFKQDNRTLDTREVRVLNNISFKDKTVSALVLPRQDEKGLLCGEIILALAEDKKSILGEGRKSPFQQGFYIAQSGNDKTLYIAENPLQAKILASEHKNSTVVMARAEEYPALQKYLHVKGIITDKLMVAKNNHDIETQGIVADKAKSFHIKGSTLSLINMEDKKITRLDPAALEKAHMKMSFEKLIRKNVVDSATRPRQTAQERLNTLKKTWPVLEAFETYSKERKQVQGFEREVLDKKIQKLANTISQDKPLYEILKREVPQLAQHIQKKISKEQKPGR